MARAYGERLASGLCGLYMSRNDFEFRNNKLKRKSRKLGALLFRGVITGAGYVVQYSEMAVLR